MSHQEKAGQSGRKNQGCQQVPRYLWKYMNTIALMGLITLYGGNRVLHWKKKNPKTVKFFTDAKMDDP
ncbi:unnamed protein product [Arabidopsis arenosa]|uniref:Uncharacterized protein n=1 Tax=Arabidopsis arenosa TaxID=38785 RepID=A0A8S2AN26_ARAAE|nr:unnamed protein product [Arabidopsis arenosa]